MLQWGGRLLAVTVAALLSAWMLGQGEPVSRALWIVHGLTVLAAGHFLILAPAALSRRGASLAVAVVSVVLVCLLERPLGCLLGCLLVWPWERPVAQLALATGVLALCLAVATRVLARLSNDPALAPTWVFMGALAGIALPLWAAPLVETGLLGNNGGNWLIALSPLSYLAVAAQWDYLRDPWFYQYTPLGGLRFDYPSTLSLSTAYLGLSGLGLIGEHLAARRERGQNDTPASPTPNVSNP